MCIHHLESVASTILQSTDVWMFKQAGILCSYKVKRHMIRGLNTGAID